MDAAEPPPMVVPAARAPGAERHDDDYLPPSLELGVGAFLMSGGGAGGYAGVSPFLVDEFSEGVYLRPSIAMGQSIGTNIRSTWAAARIDTCVRLPGRYASRNGIQLDLCGGADVGFSYVASGIYAGSPTSGQTLPYVNLGPSAGLRGEVGGMSLMLRALIGYNVAHGSFVDATGELIQELPWSVRLELAVAWDLHFVRPSRTTAGETTAPRAPAR